MILIICLALLGAAMLLSVPARRAPRSAWFAHWLTIAGTVLAAVAGGLGVGGHETRVDLSRALQLGGAGGLRIDHLSGLFLLICCAVAVPALMAGGKEMQFRPRLPASIALVLASVIVVVTADQLFILLLGWESLTLGFYLLAGHDRDEAGHARASVAAAAFGKASGASLLIGGGLLAAHSHGLLLSGFSGVTGPAHGAAYALLLIGFAIKAGVVPTQVWLPPTYSAAPGPARAIMAGVAVNVAFYGMVRTLLLLGRPPIALTTVALLIAGITALLGIAHASVNTDLTGLVAWSSVENAGLISVGFAVALVGRTESNTALTAAGLLACLMQVIAHALGKALLFASTGQVEAVYRTVALDRLRAVAKSLPVPGTGLVIGAMTLAGLPLTAGLASEWLTLEALMQQFRVQSLALRLACSGAGALVALTTGVAGVTFVRLVALTAFGTAGSQPVRPDRRPSVAGRVGILALAAACLLSALLAPFQVRLIDHGMSQLVDGAINDALASPAVLQPVFADFSALSPTWLWLVLPAMTLILAGIVAAFSGHRLWRIRRVDPWTSASPGVDRGVGYTSFGYANPMRRVLANVLRTQKHLEDAGTGPVPTRAASGGLTYRVEVVDVVGAYLYRPAWVVGGAVVRAVKRLQSGHLGHYLLYMLIALMTLLVVVAVAS